MKVEAQHSEPEHVKDREPYRLRIEGRDGQSIEIVEQLTGGFLIAAVSMRRLVIEPTSGNSIIVRTPKGSS